MKKILSLLSMLMVTMMAFATDYTDQLTFKLTSGSSHDKALPEGTLTVEKRVDGTYNVTACGCDFSTYGFENWGDISCDGVEGTTDADGLTTIQVSNPDVSANGTLPAGGFALKGESLLVKFNETKAYALFKGKLALNAVVGYAFEYTFGTDEGFESTGGGSTGGGETGGETKEEYPINFDKSASNTHGSRYSTSISLQQDGKDKQTITFGKTMKGYEDLTDQKFTVDAGAEVTPSIGYVGEWMHGYVYIDLDNNKQFSFNADGADQTGTEVVSYSYYKDKNSKGEAVASSCNVNPMPAFTAPTTPGTYRIRFKVDWDNIDAGGSVLTTNHILSNGGGIWDATLEVVAAEPEVTVKEEKSFTDAISMVAGDMSEEVGQAQVTIKEMTDETISMTLAVVGQEGAEYTASGFTKTVDTEKNRTTYTGTLNIEDEDYDVTALVYTEGTVEKLYMVAKGAEYNYVVGTNPDAATVVSDKPYTSNLRIYDGEEPVVEETEAQVNVTKYSDDTYKITLKDVSLLNRTSDLVFVGKALVDETAAADEPLTIMAKSDGATTNFFGEQMNASFELTEVSADEIKMEFAIESENFSYMGQFNYEEEKPEPEVYTSNLHIYDAAAPETDLFKADKANVEFLATETGEFTLTLKDVTLNEKTQDLVFTGTLPTTEPGGQEPLAEEGEVTPDEPAMVLNATADEATATFLGAASATAEFSISYNAADEFMMTFTMKAGEKNYGGEFNYEAKTPAAEPFCKENYVADGNGFEWEIPVDWDTQKIVMSIDPSTCTGSCEHVIGLGASPTTFHGNLQLYRTSADQMLQGYFENDGGNHNTGKFAETAPFLVEVSKAKGFVVNDEVKITASEMSELFTLPTVKMGTGEGANDKSRATYNYVKVVDKDWTKDPETGINATTVAEGEFEVFSVDGVKLSKLQKGLNIVRSADGKVKKVLVK